MRDASSVSALAKQMHREIVERYDQTGAYPPPSRISSSMTRVPMARHTRYLALVSVTFENRASST
jgi:hypothetical protein